MSLQDEMLEQNSMYQHVMQENEELKERCATLEQLVSEYQLLMAEIAVHVQVGAKRVDRIDALMDRAKAALQQE